MSQKVHTVNYVIGIVAAIIIGVDYAINGFVYMSLMGGSSFAYPLIAACCMSAFVLNSILYFQDIPGAFQTMYDNIGIPSIESLKSKKFWIDTILYLIAISGAITTAAFTYFSYISLPASVIVIPQPLILLFCFAYVFGTFAILKDALDELISSDENKDSYDFMKIIKDIEVIKNANINKFYAFLALVTTTVAGCIFTQVTVLKGLRGAILLLTPGLSFLTMPMFILSSVAELAFTVYTVIYLVRDLDIDIFYSTSGIIAFIAITLNAICESALTEASMNGHIHLTQSLGFVLSATIMIKYFEEFITDFWRDKSNERWNNVYNALFFLQHVLIISITIFLISTVIVPLITPSIGTLGAFCTGTAILALIFAIDQMIDVYSSQIFVTSTTQDFMKKGEKDSARVPLILSVIPATLTRAYHTVIP